MSSLIDRGLRQGSVIRFRSPFDKGSKSFQAASSAIKKGRIGHETNKDIVESSLFVVLSQDCSIASSTEKFLELAQLKKKENVQENKIGHFLLGQDYKKLFVKYRNEFYELEESLLTKVKKTEFEPLLDDNLEISDASLDESQKKVLLEWRILNYYRVPFPDRFNRSLAGYFAESNHTFTNYLRANRQHIHSVRIFVTPEDEENASHYYFSVTVLLYELEDEEDNPNGVPQSFQTELDNQLECMLKEFSEHSGFTCIQLENFQVGSIQLPRNYTIDLSTTIDEFSFANAYTMREFNFQYLCY
ncbi:TPA: hypothetical protein ACF37V_002731 [Vibrio parahaemolyticus]